MRQRDADPIPQACLTTFRPSATPRPTGTSRIEPYSATAILAQRAPFVKRKRREYGNPNRTFGFSRSLCHLLKYSVGFGNLLTKSSHKKFRKAIDNGKIGCIIISVSRQRFRVLKNAIGFGR